MQKHRWLFIFLGVVVLGGAVVFGAAFGAGLTYFFLHAEPVQAAYHGPVQFGAQVDNTAGVLIAGVEEGSAAADAGLVRGDILLEVNGQSVNSLMDLQSVLAEAAPGDSAELTVQHGDETRTLTVELGARGDQAYLGVNSCGGPMSGAMMFADPQNNGMMQTITVAAGAQITEVVSGSPAETAGLQVGDLIVSVDGEAFGPNAGLADLIQAHQPGDKVTLAIQSQGADAPHDVEVTLGENPDNAGQAYLGVGYQMGAPMQFNGQDGQNFYFHNGQDFQGQLPEGQDPNGNGQFYFHGMPGTGGEGMPFMDPSQLPEGLTDAVIVSEVITDTPAAQAGLQPGDLILAVDGETVTDVETFVGIMQGHKPGDQVALSVFRAGEELTVTATLAEHPDDPAKGYLGVMAGSLSIHQDMMPAQPGQDFQFELPGVPGGDS